MKILLFIFAAVVINACNTNKNTVSEDVETSTEIENETETEMEFTTEVTSKLKKGKTYAVEVDGTGAKYLTWQDGKTNVYEYKVSKKAPEGIMDANSSEIIYFQFKDSDLPLTLSGEELQQVAMMYEKQCFCKGVAGFYEVNEGTLNVSKSGDRYAIALSFSVEGVDNELNGVTKSVSAQ